MKQMVITFNPDGTAAHTLKDRFFNPAEVLDADRAIERMTDIKFDENAQGFYIEFLRGQIPDWQESTGYTVTLRLTGYRVEGKFEHQIAANINHGVIEDDSWYEGGVLMFKTYEDAVAYEIELVNALRKIGATF